MLELASPSGPVSFEIVGVFYDYTSENGSAFVSLETLEHAYGPGPINNIALYLDEGVDPEGVVDTIKNHYPDVPLRLRSNRTLREEVLAIFDQTFAVTRLLQAMSLLIAVSGVTLTLLVLARELIPELALYRALGATRRQVFGLFVGKGTGIALLGMIVGAAAGLGLAAILILVINRVYFGWTIAVHWPWGALAGQMLSLITAAVLASLYPALRASQTPATELSREDV